jgi:SAM-dependent methyltransferase
MEDLALRMDREGARRWTVELARHLIPAEPDVYPHFLSLVREACPPGGVVVDLGCGNEDFLAYLDVWAAELVGVDLEPPERGLYHRYLQADVQQKIPLPDGYAHVVACKFLLEHLDDVGSFLREARRILKPGGRLVLLTPNILYYPYAVNFLLSRVLPQECRMRAVSLLTGRLRGKVFPVYYRCNTPGSLKRELEAAGMVVESLESFSDYLVTAVARPLGLVAVLYERAVNRLGLRGAKGFLLAVARRP